MNKVDQILTLLAEDDNLRKLNILSCNGVHLEHGGSSYLNLSSNDYLGIGSDLLMQSEFFNSIGGRFVLGNPSSRLMTGNNSDYEVLEERIASIYTGKSALVFGSGYLANTGILPALVSSKDLILADKSVHASIIDGLRLCGCEYGRFNHNDLNHLEKLLKNKRAAYDDVWVVTESIFSMDGDLAPLAELVGLKHRYGLKLYVDEAHAFGLRCENGGGYACEERLDSEIDVIVGTFGKAIASYGAFAAVDPPVRELLVNRMRTLIFTTALPPIVLQWTDFVLDKMPELTPRREHLTGLITEIAPQNYDATHIIPIMAYGNAEATAMAEYFKANGFWVTPIRYPTIPKGKARMRISLNAALEMSDVKKFVEVWKSIG